MAKSLLELRNEWEEGLQVLIEIPVFTKNNCPIELDKLIVIFKDFVGKYHVHTYFPFDNDTNYQISADLQNGTADQVFKILNIICPEGVKTNII